MTVELIYLLLGVYFIGVSITHTNNTTTIDLFKLVYGIVLVVLAVVGGVKFI